MKHQEHMNDEQAQDVPRLRLFASPSDLSNKQEKSRRVKFEVMLPKSFGRNSI